MGSGITKDSKYELEDYEIILDHISLDNVDELRSIFLNNQFNIYFRLYPMGANINLLHFAVMSNACNCTKFLLSIGLDPNDKDNYGWTPLHYAAKNNNLKIFTQLLNYRANDKIFTQYKKVGSSIIGKHTPRQIAEIYKSNYIINYYKNIIPILHQVKLRDI